MKKFLIIVFVFLSCDLISQVYFTRTAHVLVKSQNNVKNIEADNYQIVSSIDLKSGDIRFEGLLKSFEFKLGALDRVFSSKSIDVSKYPKFRFVGKLTSSNKINIDNSSGQDVTVEGTLYLWDEKRKTSAQGTITSLGNGKFKTHSEFVMSIEEKSMNKLNQLIDQKLPDIVNITTDRFGVDRNIKVKLEAEYSLRNW